VMAPVVIPTSPLKTALEIQSGCETQKLTHFFLKSSPNKKGNALQEFTSLMDGCVVHPNPKA
jgi:hypothetical protein